jgi:non-heme chloroperoxidase
MGSLVATRLAVHHPQRIAGLVLIGAMRTIKGNAVIEELWSDGVATITDPIDPGFVRSFQESTLAQPVSGAFLDIVVSESMKVPANIWRAALRSMLDDDFTSMLGRITAPTHIIWGDQDGLVGRAEQRALAAAIPGATLNIHEGAGHAPHWENPGRVAAEVVAWMRQLTALAA